MKKDKNTFEEFFLKIAIWGSTTILTLKRFAFYLSFQWRRFKTLSRDFKQFQLKNFKYNYYIQIYAYWFFFTLLLSILFSIAYAVRHYHHSVYRQHNHLELSQHSIYQKPLQNVKKDLNRLLSDGQGVHPLYQMPFHAITFTKNAQSVFSKERWVSPKDNALFLAHLIKQHEKSMQSSVWKKKIKIFLKHLLEFSKKYPQFSAFYPKIFFDYSKGLVPYGQELSLTENAWLTWTLASLIPLFSTDSELTSLVYAILQKQNYRLFYDDTQKLMLLKKNAQTTDEQKHANYLWEDDVLGPLWAILHDQIPQKEALSLWQRMTLLSTYRQRSLSEKTYCAVPITRYGSLEDLEAHAFLLPHSENALHDAIDNAVHTHLALAHRSQNNGLLGSYQKLNGSLAHSGIKELALFPKKSHRTKIQSESHCSGIPSIQNTNALVACVFFQHPQQKKFLSL